MVLKECIVCEESVRELFQELRRSSSKCFTSGLGAGIRNGDEQAREPGSPEHDETQ